MKKIVLSLIAFAMLGIGQVAVNQAYADNVDTETAQLVGANYMNAFVGKEVLKPADLELVYAINNPYSGIIATYIFNIGDRAWVAVAGNDCVHPIVAYSDEAAFVPGQMPPALMWSLEVSSNNISALQNNDEKYAPTPKIATLWQNLKQGPSTKDDAPDRVLLLKASWDQGNSVRPTYNKFCPTLHYTKIDSTIVTSVDTIPIYDTTYVYDTVFDTIDDNGVVSIDTISIDTSFILSDEPVGEIHPTVTYTVYDTTTYDSVSVVGCVATAMSQIMHYWRYPVQPEGRALTLDPADRSRQLSVKLDTVVYNYSLMPDILTNSSTTEQINQVAKLCYHAGLSVRMDYAPSGSGALSYDVISAFLNNFKYADGITMLFRNQTTLDNYMGTLRGELKASRVVYMGGASSTNGGRDAAGHAWVCEGYMNSDEQIYHMNWGWGPYSKTWNNVYTNSMQVQGYNFQLRQEIIHGIMPPADSLSINTPEVAFAAPAYPNPATATINIPYTLHEAATLQIYTIDGRLVESRRLQPGSATAVVNVEHCAIGIYIYRMNGETRKRVWTFVLGFLPANVRMAAMSSLNGISSCRQ